ncbi:MAG: hypothetical protein RL094_108 [Candidatus Parcubacteria bacterium]|jgi:hypothetical protein
MSAKLKKENMITDNGTSAIIDSQKEIFQELKLTLEEQKEITQLVNFFVLALFMIITMYFFII